MPNSEQGSPIATLYTLYCGFDNSYDKPDSQTQWSRTAPTDKEYIWFKTYITYEDGTSLQSDPQLDDGSIRIVRIYDEYLGTETDTPPTHDTQGWSETMPTSTYIWTRKVTEYSNGNKEYGDIKLYNDGESEEEPEEPESKTDEAELAIVSVEIQYFGTNDVSVIPDGSSTWSETTPENYRYLWVRAKTTYEDGSITYTEPDRDISDDEWTDEGSDIPPAPPVDEPEFDPPDTPDVEDEIYPVEEVESDEPPGVDIPAQETIRDWVAAQEEIFNKLTNNGTAEGLFFAEDEHGVKQLYINMSFARTGVLQLGGPGNEFGVAQILDQEGNVISQWDKTGLTSYAVYINGEEGLQSYINIPFDYYINSGSVIYPNIVTDTDKYNFMKYSFLLPEIFYKTKLYLTSTVVKSLSNEELIEEEFTSHNINGANNDLLFKYISFTNKHELSSGGQTAYLYEFLNFVLDENIFKQSKSSLSFMIRVSITELYQNGTKIENIDALRLQLFCGDFWSNSKTGSSRLLHRATSSMLQFGDMGNIPFNKWARVCFDLTMASQTDPSGYDTFEGGAIRFNNIQFPNGGSYISNFTIPANALKIDIAFPCLVPYDILAIQSTEDWYLNENDLVFKSLSNETRAGIISLSENGFLLKNIIDDNNYYNIKFSYTDTSIDIANKLNSEMLASVVGYVENDTYKLPASTISVIEFEHLKNGSLIKLTLDDDGLNIVNEDTLTKTSVGNGQLCLDAGNIFYNERIDNKFYIFADTYQAYGFHAETNTEYSKDLRDILSPHLKLVVNSFKNTRPTGNIYGNKDNDGYITFEQSSNKDTIAYIQTFWTDIDQRGVQLMASRHYSNYVQYVGIGFSVGSDGTPYVHLNGTNAVNMWQYALGLTPNRNYKLSTTSALIKMSNGSTEEWSLPAKSLYANATYNNSISFSGIVVDGYITSGQKSAVFFIPYMVIGGTAKVTALSLAIRGGSNQEYLYMAYGSSNNTYKQLGTSPISIWANSKTVDTNGVASISCAVKVRQGFLITVNFTNTLRKSASTTVCQNNAPYSFNVTAAITLS